MAVEVPLVLEIKKNECLYNYNMPEYNRKEILDATWGKVAATVNLSVNECKDKWKNIRSSFVRSVKGSKTQKPYYLTKYLQFVVPYIKPKGMEDPLPIEEQTYRPDANDSDDGPLVKEEPPDIELPFDEIREESSDIVEQPAEFEANDDIARLRRKKRRRLSTETVQLKENERCPNRKSDTRAMKYFLLSLLPEFDSMDEEQSRLFKIKVMMLINEIKSDKCVNKTLRVQLESERLQKRLINLLLKNLGPTKNE